MYVDGQMITLQCSSLICNTIRLKRCSLFSSTAIALVRAQIPGEEWRNVTATTRDRLAHKTSVSFLSRVGMKKRTSVNFNLNQFKNIIHFIVHPRVHQRTSQPDGQPTIDVDVHDTLLYPSTRKLMIEDYLDTLSNLFIKELLCISYPSMALQM